MSFSNLEKVFSNAKLASRDWHAKISPKSFDEAVADLLQNYSWPSPKFETWKYTNILKLAKLDFWPAEQAPPDILPTQWQQYLSEDFEASFVFWNGIFIPKLSKISPSKKYDFFQIGQGDKFAQLSSNSELEKVNQLLLKDLYSFEVRKGEKVLKPFVFLYLTSNNVSRAQIHASRLQIILNEFAEACVFEIHGGLTEMPDQIESHQCEVNLKAQAHLEHCFLNTCSKGSINFFFKKFEQAAASVLKSLHIDLGGDLSRTETFVNLNEPGAEAFVNGVYLNQESQHTDHQGIIRHVAPETISHQTFKGILADQSKAVFNSKIRIEKGAAKSSAEQLNKNLLVSDQAEIDSLPRLEILNDDVKATHGSASGQLDPNQIFYLVSRAIDRKQAVQLLIEGYAFEMLAEVNSLVKDKLSFLLSKKLSSLKPEI